MKDFFENYETLGLPGGPNELKRFTNGFIISERGQWDYPGQPTAVPTPSGRITMKGVEDNLLGIDNLGNTQYMTPGNEYQFEGNMVYEIPQAKKGGSKRKPSKKYSRSLMAKNRLFAKNPLFEKKKSTKNKIFDPNSPYFQPGGETDLPIATEEQSFLRNIEGPSSYIETELTDDQIEQYRKGGYIVEDISIPSLTRMDDGGENTCPPDYYWNGQACVTRTHTEIDPRYIAEHPDEATRIQNEGEVVVSREASDIGKLRGEYREKNPIGIFLDEKKRQYLRRNKGLNKAAGVTMENFPEDVLQNFKNEYDYLTNNYAVKKLGKKEGWNPKRRGDWVNELTPGERDAVAESKYGSKLQPSYWSRSLAGLQELGNEVIQNLPVIAAGPLAPGMAIASTLAPESDVLKFDIPGLTKKEQKEIAESKLGFLETLAPLDTPGAAIANYVENRGLSTGSDYKELPNIFSGEKMANVSDTEAMLLNPLTYAGMESIPELVLNAPKLLKNSGKLIGKLESPELISNTSNILKNEVKLLPEETINLRSKVLKSVPEDAPYILRDELLPDYKTFGTKGDKITYDEGIDLLENMVKKYPVLQESPRIPVYYHGTTSASLPGIIKGEGLVPTGELIREGKVPLTGELGSGIEGINNSSISTAMARRHQGALDYAIGLSGKNKVNVEDDLAKWFERGGRESFVQSPFDPDISFFDDLKNKRLTEWQNLSDAEKALVQDNYPVMFGINPTKGNAERFVVPITDVSDELGISGKIGFEEIPSIFVPKSKVAALQEQLGAKTKVLPIEDFMQDYKNADKYNQMGYAKGGIISNLTKKEIDKLVKQGYIIEEIYKHPLTKTSYGHSVGNLIRKDNGGSVSGTQGLTADFSRRLTQMILDARAQGIDLGVGSGYRSYEIQKRLWEQALKKYGSPEKARKWVAPPGGSFHNKGLAVDLNSNGQFLGKEANSKATEWAHANAKKYGLHFRMGHEPWHIEPIEKTKSNSEKENEHDHDEEVIVDKYGDQPKETTQEEYNKMIELKNMEFEAKQKELEERERALHDDDYSDWEPAKKQEVEDPLKTLQEDYLKLIAPSSKNVYSQFIANKQSQMKKGGIVSYLTKKQIDELIKQGYIIEEIN